MRLLASLLFCTISFAQSPLNLSRVEGLWLGTLDTGAAKLRLAFHLNADGTGTLDSLDQGAKGIKIDSFSLDGTKFTLASKAVGGGFTGELIENGQKLQGIWKQGGNIPLVLVKSASLPEIGRPQMPKAPFPYRTEDVTFSSVNNDVTLAGTLTTPAGAGPFPAVVMITGSGPQDRDETLLGHKPFWVIADYLSRHGIAVLRFDDRGTAKSSGNFNASTSADFADDAEGALLFLKSRKVFPKIGLLGHSEGGVIAPMLANRNADVSFVVLLAGPAVSGDAILLEQNKLILASMGAPKSLIDGQIERLTKILTIVKAEPDVKVGAEKARKAMADVDPALKPQVEAQIQQTATPWFHYFLAYDPAPALKSLKQPLLAFSGTLDLQVPAGQNLSVMKKLLEEGGNKDFKLMEMPGLNHLFQHAKTGSPNEYSQIEETISPEVLTVLAEWIGQHGK